jgi:hypothetical protein
LTPNGRLEKTYFKSDHFNEGGSGEGLLVDLGVLGADAVADGAVGGGGEGYVKH